ncbi:chemotaxis protein CheW [Xylanibacillus composti]|uniref:Chemotaxis protein CheW n=1 Tax=Xylanibacillus composti TaxID=1572762 RepID=A0A8J4M3D9_9BACL|nr:chemotaxis protein CheW [Xylanibacillus composti]GIQ69922.1 chemotaxis protein CheW [Xylanibacillus composti]
MSTGIEQYVEFVVSEERYAVKISLIQEIIKMQDITAVPNVRPYIKGVINLRGKVVPVISLRKLFHMEEQEETKLSRIIVVNHREEAVGMLVDKVNKVTTFSDIQPPPDRLGAVSGAYLVGIGMSAEGIAGILEMEQVLLKEDGAVEHF